MFKQRKKETLVALEACMEKRSYKAGEKIFTRGDAGHELFFIRRGSVRIMLPLSENQEHHLATFGRGNVFGEMSFIDRDQRSANAFACSGTDLYVLPRERFDALAEVHPKLAINLFEALARGLAVRMRYTNGELRLLEET